jgi:hypothetical protein
LVLLLILSFATTALAQPGKYAQLGKGQMIPWSGWCFDSEAMAYILAEREGQEARCRIKLDRQAEELAAAYDLEEGKLKAQMQFEIQTRQDTIEALKTENLKIEEALIHEQKFGWIAPASIGIIVGALTMLVVTL